MFKEELWGVMSVSDGYLDASQGGSDGDNDNKPPPKKATP
tara:strand:- start:341 stop:460 length:120 start_codon:yes stop_codon:yes gene_type:complete